MSTCSATLPADAEEVSAILVERCAEIAPLGLDVVLPRMGGLKVRECAHRLPAGGAGDSSPWLCRAGAHVGRRF